MAVGLLVGVAEGSRVAVADGSPVGGNDCVGVGSRVADGRRVGVGADSWAGWVGVGVALGVGLTKIGTVIVGEGVLLDAGSGAVANASIPAQ
jgi:hypothetical protein